ncbi:MAG: enoyl-CoA hydratase/isomerase family protein [Proteobacteria bacterium]|nr:enoyl-CoA hydratase/isomerase family protein [Pseudomonadota bacterium]
MKIESGDILVEQRGSLGLLTMNRPQALNALNMAMVEGMQKALDAFEADGTIKHVAIRGVGGKAFCAGGDIRLMHDLGKADRHDEALKFWADEYVLNRHIHRYTKPYIALIDGIVMGGGVGVSLHGSHRLAGPNLMLAMPEVGIGFFPDVGATYALPRLPGASGRYLALTGNRIKRADAMHLGIATHAVQGGKEEEIIAALAAGQDVEAVAKTFAEDAGAAPVAALAEKIERYFSPSTLDAVFAALEQGAAEGDQFAADTLAGMKKKSYNSMAISLEQMKRGGNMNFEEAMVTEFRIVSRIIRDTDFYEGVRSVIIDKDNAPQWNPASLEAINPAHIEAHFAPLPRDLTFPKVPGESREGRA